MAGPFEDNKFIALYGSEISKIPNSFSFKENLFASFIEESNISRPNLVAFPDAAHL